MSEEQKSTAIAAPVDYAALMAKAAAEQASVEKPDNKFISFKSGMLSFNGNVAPGNKLKCVIVGSAFENAYFPNVYDADKVVSPDCYAVGHTEDELAPNNEATNPVSPGCAGCPHNQWVENAKGKSSKACKNVRRIALIQESDLANAAQADIMYAKLPVMSVANWSKYVNQITNVVKRPSWGVVTEMSVVPDVKSQFRVCFQFAGLVPDEALEGCYGLYERVYKEILFDYPKNKPEAEKPAPKAASKPGKY